MIRTAATFALLAGVAAAQEAEHESTTGLATPTDQKFVTFVRETEGRVTSYGVSIPDFDTGALVIDTAQPSDDWFSMDVGSADQDKVPFLECQLNSQPNGHPGGIDEATLNEIFGQIRGGDPSAQQRLFDESAWLGQPHFDIHFHVESEETARTWTCDTFPPCAGGRAAEFQVPPPEGFMPDTHFMDGTSAVPGMGTHWEEKELKHTADNGLFDVEPAFIFGSFGGQVAFWELMVTLENLRAVKANGTVQTGDIPQPRFYPKAGLWPTEWSMSYDTTREVYDVALTGLVFRSAGDDSVAASCACSGAVHTTSGTSARITFADEATGCGTL